MKQIIHILLYSAVCLVTTASARPSSVVSVSECPDFIVADIVGVRDSLCVYRCREGGTPISNQQLLYLPVNPPNSTNFNAYIIEFFYNADPSQRGSLIAWVDCNGQITLSNICAQNNMTVSSTGHYGGNSTNEIVFVVPNTPFLFKVMEPAGTFAPALRFEMAECSAIYCPFDFPTECEPPRKPRSCGITVQKECKQNTTGQWSSTFRLYYKGNLINNINDPHCCVTWEYVAGIPSIPCPRPNGFPDMNFNPLTLQEGKSYKVTIVCDDTCTYVQEGIVNCTPPLPRAGGADNRSNNSDHVNHGADLSKTPITIYPNPANNQLAIRIHPEDNQSDSYQLLLFDALGRQVLAHLLANESKWQILDISSFTPGVYTWRLMNSNTEAPLQTGKLLVQH